MKKLAKPKKFELFIKTTDQWYPNYPGNKVRVCVQDCINHRTDGRSILLVCVWGNDDYGLEKFMYFDTVKERNKAYKKWVKEVKSWKVVTKDGLKKLGLVTA